MRMLTSFGKNYQEDTQQKHMRWVSPKTFPLIKIFPQIFTTLGLLARVYPAEGRPNLTNLFDQVIYELASTMSSFNEETKFCDETSLVFHR